jgi:hypothetical protein
LLYAAVIALFLGVGLALGIGGLAAGLAPVAGVGGLFVLVGLQQGQLLAFRTACEFAFDPATGALSWRSTLGRGIVQVTDIETVKRSSRPGVYSRVTNHGSDVAFWLDTRNENVEGLFLAMRIANSSMATHDLYRKGRLWWRGLPSP